MANWLVNLLRAGAAFLAILAWSAATSPAAHALTTFSIGNSLSQDTRPQFLPDAEWHLYCAKNLDDIYNNPAGHCSATARQWDDALVNSTYDYVIVQPHFGTTLSTDAAIISEWMGMQPASTKWVIHTGWRMHEDLTSIYDGDWNGAQMLHHLDYFHALIDELAASNPAAEIILNPAVVLLRNIADDIDQGTGPYNDLADLYRDHIHMSLVDGQYVQHNLLRTTLGLPIETENFPAIQPDVAAYLNSKIAELVPLTAAIPEPSAWALGALISSLCTARWGLRYRRRFARRQVA